MNNELFKELYYEAKGHEKHANLNNLVSRSKKYDQFIKPQKLTMNHLN